MQEQEIDLDRDDAGELADLLKRLLGDTDEDLVVDSSLDTE